MTTKSEILDFLAENKEYFRHDLLKNLKIASPVSGSRFSFEGAYQIGRDPACIEFTGLRLHPDPIHPAVEILRIKGQVVF